MAVDAGGRAGGHWRGDALRAARAAVVRHDAVFSTTYVQFHIECPVVCYLLGAGIPPHILSAHLAFHPERQHICGIMPLPPYSKGGLFCFVCISMPLNPRLAKLLDRVFEFGDGGEHYLYI